ncbi:MAG TPA: hypothetical protein VNX86_12845 [Rhizomicrobium sp.]|jgi:hypothetical protein|nr:hypothetical protein [Rhizomicrobium sp.]
MTKPQKRKRNRTIPHIFGNSRLDELLFQLLDDSDPRLRMYVYRMRDDEKVVPAIFVGMPFSDLFDWLRDEHGGGAFHIIIRRGKSMEISGIICIGVPVVRPSR